MFGFLFHRKRQEVHKALANRINHKCLDGVRHAARSATRSPFCEVMWLIPDRPDRLEALDEMIPVVGKDISTQGIAIIHQGPLEHGRVIIGMNGSHGPSFLRTTVEHSTSLGYGFWQIGLAGAEVLILSAAEADYWQTCVARFDGSPVDANEPAAVGV